MPLLVLLFLIMFTLKLAGVIGLSWIIVTAPLWVPFAVFLAVFVTGFICILVGLKWRAPSKGSFLPNGTGTYYTRPLGAR